ncbi:MAG: ATP-binding protein, partial [Sphaerochaetaceae bacterium]|nr:ATP-binding protein [Sphaerochaetaceae bacterium]
RFNIKGKELMKTNHKFYIVDLGLRHALIGSPGDDFGAALENIVFFELIRRGYQVTVGTYQDYEIDFIAHRSEETLYIQVCASILNETTRERELRSLRLPDDNYPRILLSMDRLPFSDFDGIRQMHILDFLLSADMPQ